MTTRPPSDFSTYKEALEYANTRLDEWKERFREMEKDLVLLGSNPPLEDVKIIVSKWNNKQGGKLNEYDS